MTSRIVVVHRKSGDRPFLHVTSGLNWGLILPTQLLAAIQHPVRDLTERIDAQVGMKYWQIITNNLSKAGFSWGCSSEIDSTGQCFSLRTHTLATVGGSLFCRTKKSAHFRT
jgi:hypothetical protein